MDTSAPPPPCPRCGVVPPADGCGRCLPLDLGPAEAPAKVIICWRSLKNAAIRREESFNPLPYPEAVEWVERQNRVYDGAVIHWLEPA